MLKISDYMGSFTINVHRIQGVRQKLKRVRTLAGWKLKYSKSTIYPAPMGEVNRKGDTVNQGTIYT